MFQLCGILNSQQARPQDHLPLHPVIGAQKSMDWKILLLNFFFYSHQQIFVFIQPEVVIVTNEIGISSDHNLCKQENEIEYF